MGIFRQSVGTLASRLTITLVNIPISMIIVRTLGAEGQGIYSSAITFPGLWASFGLCGLDAGHLYYVSRDRRKMGPAAANAILLILLALAVLLPSYLLLVQPLTGDQGASFRPYLLLSSVVVPLIVARHMTLSLFLGLGKVETYNGLQVASQLGLLALVAGGLLVAGGGTRFVIVAYQISLILFLVPSLFWLRRQMTREDRDSVRISKPLLRDSLSFGLKGHPGIVFAHFTYRFDTLLVLPWLGAAAQGYYSIAVLLAEKLNHLPASVQFVLFPRISASTREQADRITPLVCRSTLFWVTGAGLVMFVLGRFLIRLFYTAAYYPALGAYQVLLPGVVALTVSAVLSSDLSGRNRRIQPTIAMACAFAVNLILDLLWIRRYGILGAAWASSIAYVLQSILMAFFFWRITGISPLRLIVPERADVELYKRIAARTVARLGGRKRNG